MFDRPEFSVGAIHINPSVDIKGRSPLTGTDTTAKDIAPSALVPNIHFVAPLMISGPLAHQEQQTSV